MRAGAGSYIGAQAAQGTEHWLEPALHLTRPADSHHCGGPAAAGPAVPTLGGSPLVTDPIKNGSFVWV